jgi:hypothetical protein
MILTMISIWELGPCGYVWICWVSMDIYGYMWILLGLQRNISDLMFCIRYPSWISIHIHAYPFMSIKELQRYPHFISKNHISALFMLLSIKVSIHIRIPLCISMCIQVRSPSNIYIHIHTVYLCTNHLHIQIFIYCIETYSLISSFNLIRYPLGIPMSHRFWNVYDIIDLWYHMTMIS